MSEQLGSRGMSFNFLLKTFSFLGVTYQCASS